MNTIQGRNSRHSIPKLAFCIFCFFLMSNAFIAKAQRFSSSRTNGIGVNVAYDAPLGKLKQTYKPAANYGLNYYSFDDNYTITVGIGLRTYKLKQDIFYYEVGDGDYGTISYTDFSSYYGYLGAAYNIGLSERVKIFIGANLGMCISKFSSHSEDAYVIESNNIKERQVYGAPKLGFTIDLNDYLQLNVQGAYNVFATLGRTEFNSRAGTTYTSYTIGSGITFKF